MGENPRVSTDNNQVHLKIHSEVAAETTLWAWPFISSGSGKPRSYTSVKPNSHTPKHAKEFQVTNWGIDDRNAQTAEGQPFELWQMVTQGRASPGHSTIPKIMRCLLICLPQTGPYCTTFKHFMPCLDTYNIVWMFSFFTRLHSHCNLFHTSGENVPPNVGDQLPQRRPWH